MKTVAIFGLIAIAIPVHAQAVKTSYPSMAPVAQYMMERNAEIALARSAAPSTISKDAEVLVLARGGYDIAVKGSVRPTSLIDVFDAKGSNLAQRTAKAEEKLREHLSGSVGKQTGVVNLSVSTPDAVLSKLVVERILDAVNAFNLQKRQSRATAERKFTEGRLATARSELLMTENHLQNFMQENRVYSTAPRLSF